MRNWIIAFLLIFTLTLFFATPAKKALLAYDLNKNELSVDFEHEVVNVKTHYIKEIIVYLNGNVVIDKKYTSQATAVDQKDSFKLTAKKGDKIAVVSICNIGGEYKGEIIVK